MRVKGFIADAMLGSLARKLRAFGFDTLYYKRGDDEGMLRLAKSTGRTVITADRKLADAAEKRRITVLLVKGASDSKRIQSMLAASEEKGLSLSPRESRCSICNGALVRVSKEAVIARLPKSVALRHRYFMECGACRKLYWRGSHWKKLRRLGQRFVEAQAGG
jgi:uncharacterized protein with PIN domain